MRDSTVRGKATQDELWTLHRLLAQHFLEVMAGEDKPSAAMLAQARRFLADNSILLTPLMAGAGGDARKALAEALANMPVFVDPPEDAKTH